MATKTKTSTERPRRMQVRLTEAQASQVDELAAKSYRTSQQVVQMMFDQALLGDGYRAAAGEPTPMRSE